VKIAITFFKNPSCSQVSLYLLSLSCTIVCLVVSSYVHQRQTREYDRGVANFGRSLFKMYHNYAKDSRTIFSNFCLFGALKSDYLLRATIFIQFRKFQSDLAAYFIIIMYLILISWEFGALKIF
jgi:hypothetical protein